MSTTDQTTAPTIPRPDDDSPLPPVTCTPWCSDGNGHGGALFAGDQRCISVPVQIPGSLLRPDPEDTSGEPEYVCVYGEGWANDALPSQIHIGQSESAGPELTLDEARQVAEAILRTIATVDGATERTVLDEDLGLGVDNDDENVYLEGDMRIDKYVFSPKEARDLAYAILAHAARVEVLELAPTVTA